jgi:wyosine [tRNA(Phe)-imidazoG37] synthetase (radical SAM superfamily)
MDPLNAAFAAHSRRWRDFRYVYPVIARRSRGVSLGINLNPDRVCTFDCVYCCVDRQSPPGPRDVELAVLADELRHLAAHWATLFDEPPFAGVPVPFRRLNDFAFSGDGEPTVAPSFPAAARLAVDVRQALGLDDLRIVVITNTTGLPRPEVQATLRLLDAHGGELWAKLDAGTEAWYERMNRTRYPLARVLENLLAAALVRPIVIQSLFLRLGGQAPPAAEIDAYLGRLRALRDAGARLKLVQVYTVARPPADASVTPLTAGALEEIAARVRALGVPAEVFA